MGVRKGMLWDDVDEQSTCGKGGGVKKRADGFGILSLGSWLRREGMEGRMLGQ